MLIINRKNLLEGMEISNDFSKGVFKKPQHEVNLMMPLLLVTC